MKRSHALAIVSALLLLTCAGLFFTAVQKVRQASARMQCHGNFKGLACSLHSYAAAHDDALPTGTIPNAHLPPEQRLSWLVSLLPFIEQDRVFKQFDLTRGPGDARNQEATNNRFRYFVCASSSEHVYFNRVEKWNSSAPLTHYVGVAGVGGDAATLEVDHTRAGAFGYDRRTSLKKGFPDGTSNTLLIIETANNPGHWAYGGTATVRALEPGASPYIGPDRPFGGWHSRISVVALADGSVRTFLDTTDSAILEAFATVAGKEELPANW